MQKQNKNDNAANRKSYVGKVYNIGEKKIKNDILDGLNPEWKNKYVEEFTKSLILFYDKRQTDISKPIIKLMSDQFKTPSFLSRVSR